MAKVVQINLNHCAVAQDLLCQVTREERADIAIVSEPYRNHIDPNWIGDSTNKVAIWVCGNLNIRNKMNTPSSLFTWVEVDGMRIYSCYLPPSLTIDEFQRSLDSIVASARTSKLPIVIGGDFNAWATEWGSARTNYRGRLLLEAFGTLEVEIANTGTKPTFTKGHKSSIVDLTFIDPRLMDDGLGWRVSNRYTGSDHQAIIYQLQLTNRTACRKNLNRTRWAPATFDHQTFLCVLEEVSIVGTAEEKAQSLLKTLTAACDASMSIKKNTRGRPPVHWWNEDIAAIRRECLQARRQQQRARERTGPTYEQLKNFYEVKRKKLKVAIKTAKRKCWQDFCEEVDSDPWGKPYKTVMQKIKPRGTHAPSCRTFLDGVVRHLFPEHQRRQNDIGLKVDDAEKAVEAPGITRDELTTAAKKIIVRKAPGLDGIPGLAIKTAVMKVPSIFETTFGSCLQEGTFPEKWKVQRLVLLLKGSKPLDSPSSYRPLCMIDIVGKLLERIIYNRLETSIQEAGGLSDYQYGFRKGRSAVDAIRRVVGIATDAIQGSRWTKRMCAIIALDIQNAFNSARWADIMLALEEHRVPFYLRRIISNYLSDRILLYDTDEGTQSYNISGGVPQGSVLGPLLWNVLYDGLLRQILPDGVTMVAYADDVALVVVAKSITEVQYLGDDAIEIVSNWLNDHGLRLAPEKTEAVLISRTKKRKYAAFMVEGKRISTADTIKYLGVTLDARLSFREHLETAGMKAARVARALAGIMPNIGGPKQPRRLLLSMVVSSVILYASPIWVHMLKSRPSYGAACRRAYRIAALRVAHAYRSVSDIALSVITGLPPLDLLASERAAMYQNGQQLKKGDPGTGRRPWSEDTRLEWQRRWDDAVKGRWTYRIIPDVQTWISRKHGFVNFHLTQVLTGHGCFRSYLYRIGVYASAECPSCPGRDEDVEHVLFECPRFSEERELFAVPGASLTPEAMGKRLLMSEKGWDSVVTLATTIVTKLISIRREEEEAST